MVRPDTDINQPIEDHEAFIEKLERVAFIFPPSLLPWVFQTIFKEWDNFFKTTRAPLENRITKSFVGYLQSCQGNRQLPFFFDANVKLLSSGKDVETGEVDIRVMHGKRPKVFFAFECKRLNVTRNGKYAGQAGEYVGEGGVWGVFYQENMTNYIRNT